MIAGWLERRQREVVDYLVEKNRTLKQQLGKRRLRLNDHQRRRLTPNKGRLPHSVAVSVCA